MAGLMVETCPSNQWTVDIFQKHLGFDEEKEVRVAAAYDKPIDRPVIRDRLLLGMLACVIPAGNA